MLLLTIALFFSIWLILLIRYKWKIWPFIVCFIITALLTLSLFYNPIETNLPGGYIYNSQRKDIVGKFDIPPTIINYDYDDDFIFLEQGPKYPIHAMYNIKYYDYTYGEGKLFWIIDTKKQEPIGPIDSVLFYKDSILHRKK